MLDISASLNYTNLLKAEEKYESPYNTNVYINSDTTTLEVNFVNYKLRRYSKGLESNSTKTTTGLEETCAGEVEWMS